MISQARLKELVVYDPETGHFCWRIKRYMRNAGDRAGSVTVYGYNQLCLDGKTYRAARMAWLYMTGDWPDRLVDHINRDKCDDRWSNLRLATDAENNANKVPGRNNKSGFRGVCFVTAEGKWRAMLQQKRGQKGIFLGMFDTAEEASAVYQAKAKEVYGEFVGTTECQ